MVLYRSALTGSLYAKTLRLTSMAARELGQVRSFYSPSDALYVLMLIQGAATTYMSVDVDNATSGFQTLQDLWAAVLTIVIACTMLWYKAGYVMFAPLLFIVTLIALTSTFYFISFLNCIPQPGLGLNWLRWQVRLAASWALRRGHGSMRWRCG